MILCAFRVLLKVLLQIPIEMSQYTLCSMFISEECADPDKGEQRPHNVQL